ncbi:MAG: IS1182 family transposase [Candidatus Rokuibacteriota bacterium]
MDKTYRPYDPDQLFLMPPNLRDWLPREHLAYFVSDVVDDLDLSAIFQVYEREARGYPPYHPALMVKVLLYGYATGVRSSRRLARACVEDVAFRVLAANNTPDFRTLSEFRRRHLAALGALFQQVLGLCRRAGLVKLGTVALDSTKIKANASKHKAMSYARMERAEHELEATVRRILEEAEQVDREEDARFGPDRRGDELPAELADPVRRLEKIREAKAALEREAQEQARRQADAARAKLKERDRRVGSSKGCPPRVPDPTQARPAPTAQRNFTDPDSKIMKGPEGVLQAYNAQAVVDARSQVIVAHDVSNQPSDVEHLVPMVEQVIARTRRRPRRLLADAGYCSEANLAYLDRRGIESYVATERVEHGAARPRDPRGRPPGGLTWRERMDRRLRTLRGQAVYRLRMLTAEPVFGQIKHARGFRQFLLRGGGKVRGEWALMCTAFNLGKLWSAAYG